MTETLVYIDQFIPSLIKDHREDVFRIVVKMRQADYVIGLHDAVKAWESVSEDACAGWLSVASYTDEEIVQMVVNKCGPVRY